MRTDDTIAAISSAVGPAARMIVRLSGPDAWRIAAGLSRSIPAGGNSVARCTLAFADLAVPAWVYVFRSPRSYTGEDLVELHVPGNPVIARLLLDHLYRHGARPAEAGEFTARAYFNGRLDLTAAEGVAATIAAGSEQELLAARQLLAGELARRLRSPMDAIAETLALVEVGIDFADEDVALLSPGEVEARVAAAAASLQALLVESGRFERLAHEPQFVLVGRPNAGKSTLLNALAGTERAVTSPVAGTTRDALTAEVVLPRGVVRATDVAGIESTVVAGAAAGVGDSADAHSPGERLRDVERQMRRRALDAVASADHVVLVRDATDPRPALELPRPADLVVFSKSDLPGAARTAAAPPGPPTVCASARTGHNLDALRAAMDALAFGSPAARPTLALNARHLRSIDEALEALRRAAATPGAGGAPAEVLALELRDALDALGRVLGHVSPDDLLGRVFASFCIGK